MQTWRDPTSRSSQAFLSQVASDGRHVSRTLRDDEESNSQPRSVKAIAATVRGITTRAEYAEIDESKFSEAIDAVCVPVRGEPRPLVHCRRKEIAAAAWFAG